MDIRGWSTGLLNKFHHTGFTLKSKLRNWTNHPQQLESGVQEGLPTDVEGEDSDASVRSSSRTKQDEIQSKESTIMAAVVNATLSINTYRIIHNLFHKYAMHSGLDFFGFQQMLKDMEEESNTYNNNNNNNDQKCFDIMDSNRDGVVSEEEFEKSYHQIPHLQTHIQMCIKKDKEKKREKRNRWKNKRNHFPIIPII